MIKYLRTSLLGLLVLPLAAQSSDFSASGGLINGLDSLKKATNNTFGLVVGVDYTTHFWGTDIPVRVGLSYAFMPGSSTSYAASAPAEVTLVDGSTHTGTIATSGTLKTSLNLLQVHGDALLDTGVQGLNWFVGLSANFYSMKRDGGGSWTFDGTDGDATHLEGSYSGEQTSPLADSLSEVHYPVRDAGGLKLGLRLGVIYAFSKTLSGEFTLQQTELAGKDLTDPRARAGGVNPAWLQLGVNYHF